MKLIRLPLLGFALALADCSTAGTNRAAEEAASAAAAAADAAAESADRQQARRERHAAEVERRLAHAQPAPPLRWWPL